MFYFLPAWYRDDGSWDCKERVWYRASQRNGFDDTINQVRMFHQAGEAVSLLVPVYFPDLRYFCYQEKIFEVPMMSLFDVLQGIPADLTIQPLDYHDFDWPPSAELVYGPFCIYVYDHGQLYACLYHNAEGVLIRMDRLSDQHVFQVLDFDDRGFLSRAKTLDQDGKVIKSEYFDHLGNRQFIIQADGTVQLSEQSHLQLNRSTYPNLTALIQDCFAIFAQEQLKGDDVLVAAAAANHDQLLTRVVPQEKLVFSYFSDRVDLTNETEQAMTKKAQLVIADSSYNYRRLRATGAPTVQLPPLDTRLQLGTSNQERLLKVFMLIDRAQAADRKVALRQLMELMEENHLIDLTLASYHNQEYVDELNRLVAEITAEEDFADEFRFNQEPADDDNNELTGIADSEIMKGETVTHYIHFEAIDSEPHLIEAIHATRLLIDLGERPDVFLQIAGISAGIPELLRTASIYVKDGENGRHLKHLDPELKEATDFYLTGVKNWNQALAQAAQRIADYTSGKIVTQMKAALTAAREGKGEG